MSKIIISNLHSAGSDLFSDFEDYLNELSEGELSIQGGLFSLSSIIISWTRGCV